MHFCTGPVRFAGGTWGGASASAEDPICIGSGPRRREVCPPPNSSIIVGALPMFGEVEPFLLDFGSGTQADRVFERKEQYG